MFLMSGPSSAEKAFFAPFIAFMGVMMISQMVSGVFDGRRYWVFSNAQYWMHPLQVLVCGGLLIRWWRHYEWRLPARVVFTIFIGVLTLVLWVSPLAYLGEKFFGLDPRKSGFNPAFFGADGWPYWCNLGCRFFRLVIIVPLVEEIFWRGFLLRWLIDQDFLKVPFGTFQWKAFSIVALLFMLAHTPPDWPAALLTGALFNLVAIRTRSLSSCVLVHAVTNLGLGIYILQTGRTGFW